MTKKIEIKKNLIDRFVEWRNPTKALQRYESRARIMALDGFFGASKRRNATKNWNPKKADTQSILTDDYTELCDRSADLYRNNPIASGALQTHKTNTIGRGLRVQSQIDRDVLLMSEDQAQEWQSKANRIFNSHVEKPCIDAKRVLNFAAMQDVAYLSVLLTGDVIAQRQYRKTNISELGTCYRLIHSSRLSNPNREPDRENLSGGVESDDFGAVFRYHIANKHPYDYRNGIKDSWGAYNRYAQDGYTQDILHAFRQVEIGQNRGWPVLAPVIEILKQLGTYSDAELTAAVINGLFTVYIETAEGEEAGFSGFTGEKDSESSSNINYDLGSGNVVGLAPGQKASSAAPGRPNPSFDPFFMAIVRQIGIALELPYEILIKHFTASYSASRAALNEAWRTFLTRRTWFADAFCQPIYESIITEAISLGLLSAPGYFRSTEIRRAYLNSKWIGDPRSSIDPSKDISSATDRVSLGITTLYEETVEYNGGDYYKNYEQRKKEAEMEGKLKGSVSDNSNETNSSEENLLDDIEDLEGMEDEE